MDFEEALAVTTAPLSLQQQLALIDLDYVDLGGEVRTGQLVVHKTLADEVTAIFDEILATGFPIARMDPIVVFGWDDDASMAANNTSSFCHRAIAGTTRLSAHSKGAAIDINPAFNPFDSLLGVKPKGALYHLNRPGTLSRQAGTAGNDVIEIFARYGWFWLGEREPQADRHHFEKIGYRDAIY